MSQLNRGMFLCVLGAIVIAGQGNVSTLTAKASGEKRPNGKARSSTVTSKIQNELKQTDGSDRFLGLTREEVAAQLPTAKHSKDFSRFTIGGTDTSTTLEFVYKEGKVSKFREINWYGYPRPGAKKDVEIGPWVEATKQH